MRIRIGYEIAVTVPAPTPMILMLNVRPEVTGRLSRPDTPFLFPDVPTQTYTDGFGNTCVRLVAPPGSLTMSADTVIEDSGVPDPVNHSAMQIPIEDLPNDALQFLLASRYCEVDLLSGIAWDTFGNTPLGWGRVQAVNNFVHRHVAFGYQHARPTKTAMNTFNEKTGVCRDYQHLAVTFCRALGIPARYATGYLGDIRQTPVPGPMDFSAWYQVYLDNRWWNFDARHNRPFIGRTLMGVGRDAADVALMTTFGAHSLDKFVVITDEIGETEPDATEAAWNGLTPDKQ